jgi:sensor domain CHASE-containing protein
MNGSLIWALVTVIAVIAAWDMVRRWSFATATRALKADLDALRAEIGDAKLPERVKKLETVVNVLKTHAETQRIARVSPFGRKAGG